jgi:hypothetical protein
MEAAPATAPGASVSASGGFLLIKTNTTSINLVGSKFEELFDSFLIFASEPLFFKVDIYGAGNLMGRRFEE